MNKYYLGLTLPFEMCLKLAEAQAHARPMLAKSTRTLTEDEMHITSLFIGKCPAPAAQSVINDLMWRRGPIHFRMEGAGVFTSRKGPHALVVKLNDLNGSAGQLHRFLHQHAASHPNIPLVGKTWDYSPHVTLAKCEGSPDLGLIEACDSVNANMSRNVTVHEFECFHLTLFEKGEGAESYTPYRVVSLS